MNRRWLFWISISLTAFACLVIASQLAPPDGKAGDGFSSIVQSHLRGKQLARISGILERDRVLAGEEAMLSAGPGCRQLDMVLPKYARIFMPAATGTTNFLPKFGIYAFLTYYLFPREIAVSLDQPGRVTLNGFLGRTTASDEEILAHGFNVRIDMASDGTVRPRIRDGVALGPAVDPAWFSSGFDGVIAFLLPLLTAVAGLWLLRSLFPTLGLRMPLLEQLPCALGLGMMAVAALTLGVKLCGFHGRGLVLLAAAVGALLAVWRDRKAFVEGMSNGLSTALRNPVATTLVLAGLLVFLILFRLAALQGLVEFDAVMAWALKAKMMHLYTGSELVQWFSNPRLAHAHLDYPTLVPSLHAATYDSLGHVNEFVTKFWPAWMLLLLLAGLASLNRSRHKWLPGPYFLLLALLLLPATQRYVQREGGALPMAFFTVLGMVQCVIWLMGKDRARLALGLTLLFGAAMAKFEGCVFLALAVGWILLRPSVWPSMKPSPGLWRVLGFCFLAALPFFCLRLRIPVLEYESNWAGYALHSPGATLASWPRIFLVLVSRQFVSPDLANWSGDTGRLEWIGHWAGVSSLYNPSTLGLAWLCLFLSLGLWFAVPARRPVIFWVVAMVVSFMAALSGVFAGFIGLRGLAGALTYLGDQDAGRYLFPILMAWPASLLTLMFAEPPSPASNAGRNPAISSAPASPSLSSRRKRPQPTKPRPMKSLFFAPRLPVLLLFLALVQSISAQTNPAPQPLQSPPLQELADRAVQQTLTQFAARKLETNQIAVTLVDLRDPQKPVQASYRGGERIYPASVIKLFYLVAVHRWMEDGKLQDTPELRRGMRDMIVDSLNEATGFIVDSLTGTSSGSELPPAEMEQWYFKRNVVNRYYASLGYTNINVNRKPWCEGPYGREMQSVQMHKPNHRNWLTTDATARLLTEIATGTAISAKRCTEMLEILKREPFAKTGSKDDQAHAFTGLALPPGSKLWSKAGWTSQTRHDAAYVELPGGARFVLVTFTVDHANERDIIPSVARTIVEGLARTQ